jgi:hypothetical protein
MVTEELVTAVNEEGHLVLPPELARRYGLIPGPRFALETILTNWHSADL